MTISKKKSVLTVAPGSDQKQEMIQFNNLVQDVQNILTGLRNMAYGNAGLVINSNFDVKNGSAVSVTVGGVMKTLSANTNFDTGTSQVIAINKWSAAILTWDGTTARVRWSTTLNAASEAAAIAVLPSVPSGEAAIGYITVLTGSGVTWTAGTDALQGGTGGTPATTTNYYNDPTLNGTYGFPSGPTAYQIAGPSGTLPTFP